MGSEMCIRDRIASLALVSKYGMPPLDWQNVMARLELTWVDQYWTLRVFRDPTHHSLVLLDIDLVTEDDKWETLWVHWARLNQELVAPAVQGVE